MKSRNPQAAPRGAGARIRALAANRLVRQNAILFSGGLLAGIGGFVYHAIAARVLGPDLYGEVASLVALFAVAMAPTYILILVLARYAATLKARSATPGIRHLMLRTSRLILLPSLAGLVVLILLSFPGQGFLHLNSIAPMIWLSFAIVMIWQVAVPRGILQGVQRFPSLSINLSGEMVMRTGLVGLLLALGLGVTGSMISLLAGAMTAYLIGIVSLRDLLKVPGETVRLRAMAGFSVTAAVGTLGILLLYNLDVILAKHYLGATGAGLYGGLNKVETILYFLTLSVSQVMFPRVVEAIAHDHHPGRLLLLSAGIMSAMGAGALLVFGVAPRLVVGILFGKSFLGASPFIFEVGVIGLALSLNNLLIQFFMAAHDRVFMPILAGACVLEAGLILQYHSGVGAIVLDVLISLLALLAVLAVRALVLMPRLRPEMVAEEAAVA